MTTYNPTGVVVVVVVVVITEENAMWKETDAGATICSALNTHSAAICSLFVFITKRKIKTIILYFKSFFENSGQEYCKFNNITP